MQKVLPKSEHRWCARHIYANWSKKWRGGELKKKFWICAWSTYDEEFKDNLKKIGELSKTAAEDLLKYPPHAWCRAYFSSRSHNFMVDNNITESFNSWVLAARHKPIVSMLEDIRLQSMTRIANNKKMVEKWSNEWSPACMTMYQDNNLSSAICQVVFNGDQGFEIGEGDDKHTVILDKKLCTCRAWELTGIPCAHAIRALHHLKVDPKPLISHWYSKTAYEAAYQFPLQPVPGKKFMKCDEYEAVEPPPVKKMPGRPRKKRVRSSNEPTTSTQAGKLSRNGQRQQCTICNQEGHNRVTCPKKGQQVSLCNL